MDLTRGKEARSGVRTQNRFQPALLTGLVTPQWLVPVNLVVMLNTVKLCRQKQLQLFKRLKYYSTTRTKDSNFLSSRFSTAVSEDWNISHVLYKYKQVHTNVFFIQEKYFEFSWNLGKVFKNLIEFSNFPFRINGNIYK